MYSLELPLRGNSNEYTQHKLLCRRSIDFPELAIFAFRPGAMINLHWFEPPMARTLFHGPKGVRAIEVRLYIIINTWVLIRSTLLKHFLCISKNRFRRDDGLFYVFHHYIHSTLVNSNSLISNNCLSRSEILVPVLTCKSKNR